MPGVSAPPRLDAVEAYCWACGAAEGDYDSFVDKKARLALGEPHDSRLRCDLGLQWFCDLCLSGRAMMLTSEQSPPARRWLSAVITRRYTLAAWQD